MVDYLTNDEELTDIANAIRYVDHNIISRSYPNGFVSAISMLSYYAAEPPIFCVGGGISISSTLASTVFAGNLSLNYISLTSVTSIAASAFAGCTALSSAYFPICTSIGAYAFSGCTSLTNVTLTKLEMVPSNAFRGCTKLQAIALRSSCRTIGSSAFYGCTSLAMITLQYSSVVKLSNRNAFGNTPISTSSGARIRVPTSLYSAYIKATNWVSYKSKIMSI